VHTGDRDRAVPTHQSWSLFRALQYLGKTEVRFMLYPDEPHGLQQWPHRQRRLEEDLAWLDRHLFEMYEPIDDALPEDSHLASWIERQGASRVGEVLGVEIGGVLVPETVPTGASTASDGVAVGRFEVTRAQWVAFRPDEATGSDGDLPMAGISLDDARDYVAWLGEQTGVAWRLPTVEEAEEWAGDGGNVLDRWVGHQPNVDDAVRLRERLTAVGVSLLRPVGDGVGTILVPGGPRVFDLDGNVAEWAGDGESGRAIGPSAERASGSDGEPDPAYVGLRVVREP
ncbi:MAG: prolyl oligopeptidase family serine peptidase, partial [Acidobacteriota bacterium]